MSEDTIAAVEQDTASAAITSRVLLVDDQFIIGEAVRRMLVDQPDIEFHYISDSKLAIEAALRFKPTVILQDIVMPVLDGFRVIQDYRANPHTCNIPVIVLSTKEDPKLKAEGFAVGANDYVVKLPDKLELLARIRYHSGAYISRLQRDEAFQSLRESQKKLAELNLELQKLASLDGLTGIANRRRFDDSLNAEWERGKREGKPLSLLMFDIDHFKLYNDTHGHLGGDFCLKKVAAVLTESLKRPADLVARYGGEEFAILLPDTDLDGALVVAGACCSNVKALNMSNPAAKPINVVTVSVGVATIIPTRALSHVDLIGFADQALYQAKHSGRNRVFSYAPDVQEQ